jgi:DNA-binding PucR family transcriptional regulator
MAQDPAVVARDQMSRLQSLLLLAMLMIERGDEGEILHLATSSVASFGDCRVDGAFLTDGGWYEATGPCARPQVQADVEAQFAVLNNAGGAITILGEAWGWAFPLRAVEGHLGYLVVAADAEPTEANQFLLRVLAQETGIALMNARSHARERATAAQLRIVNAALAESVSALERSTAIHDRLTRVAFEGEGQQGIADVLHELTGHPIAVEDAYGNLRAWAGPNRPDPYPKEPPARRAELLRRVELEGQPLREGDRLVALAGPGDSRGVLVLRDDGAAGPQDRIALEYGATVLAMELARMQQAAESDWRLRRDLVDELLTGVHEERALARAQAIGYDLQRPHRVLVVTDDHRPPEDEALFHAVRRAARDTGTGTLLVARSAMIVVLADADDPRSGVWERFRGAVQREVGRARCRVGVGDVCRQVADFPRSYRQAQLALRIQEGTGAGPQSAVYEELGVYQLFGDLTDLESLEEFAMKWLGPLLEYDAQKNSELVFTLDRYLAAGGSYDASAKAVGTHRSTLKYRLQRIRDISRLDLGDPDILFNLQLATRAWSTLLALRSV